MEIISPKTKTHLNSDGLEQTAVSRRKFLGYAGIFGATATLISASGLVSCHKDHPGNSDVVDLGSGDTGVLNYAYALEQLEAAFYTKVVMSQYSEITTDETSYLTDIRDHEIAHREFFKSALGSSAIRQLEVNLDSIDFSSRDSVLATAKAFEDLGVSAYNGAGKLLTDVNYLLIAGKIVSVEARHAALVRDLITNNSFAGSDVIDTNGLDKARTPNEVLLMAAPFLKTKLSAAHLPS